MSPGRAIEAMCPGAVIAIFWAALVWSCKPQPDPTPDPCSEYLDRPQQWVPVRCYRELGISPAPCPQ